MKRVFLAVFIFILAGLSSVFAQCDVENLTDLGINELQNKGFTFVKSYKIDGQGGAKTKVEFSYVFSKETNYYFVINGKDGRAKGIILNIYDSDRRELSSNFDRVNNKFYSEIIFPCKATGIYYITFTFDNSKSYCGSAVIGFKRNN